MAAIESTAFSDPWPASAFDSVMEMSSARVTVAVDSDDRPMGYCVLLTAADQGEIANLAVATLMRRQGVAGALLDEALAVATAHGVVTVFLEVRESNTGARTLYESRRFSEIGRRKGYYQRPAEDALVLQWQATSGNRTVT